MDSFTIIVAFVIISLIFIINGFDLLPGRGKKLPPGPRPLPIIGSLHLLGNQPHKSLAKLAKAHGPIMFLRLGFKNTVVISSAPMAKEVLQKQDLAFSSRAIFDSMRAHDHDKASVVLLPVGPRWRSLRKILNSNIFSGKRLDVNQHLRRQKVGELVEYCRLSRGEAVDLGRAAFRTALNLLSNTIFSKDLEDPLSDSGKELKDLIGKIMVEVGKPNVIDFFPFLQTIDPQGIRRRTSGYFARLSELLNALIDERVENRKCQDGGNKEENVIDVLLTSSQEHVGEIDRTHIETLCFDLISAGTDTTSSTFEWAMAEALNKPRTIRRVKAVFRLKKSNLFELDQVIGNQKILDEDDIKHMPYLQCMVKETLRLHPPVPFLIPRKVEHDVEVCGYVVPKNSQVFVNAWAIGRDADAWTDPLEFKPDRFLDSDVDVRGRDFELIPFGAGRRICPGLPLAMRMVMVMLGSLLNSFDWEIEGGIHHEDLNMEEKFGITLQKAYPLRAIPLPL